MSTFTWGTITALNPLRVKLDGDAAALLITPISLVDPLSLAPGDRVRCELDARRLLIHGRSGGEVARVAALEKRIPGVVPASVVVGSGTATVAADGSVLFTGCTSVSLNNIFDGSGADIYEVFMSSQAAAQVAVSLRVRAAGTDYSSASYYHVQQYASFAGWGGGANNTSAAAGSNAWSMANGSVNHARLTLFGPYKHSPVDRCHGLYVRYQDGPGGQYPAYGQLAVDGVNNFDGLTWIFSGASSGYIKVVKAS